MSLPRIGHGYDVHRMAEGRRLVLGGVEVPCERGLLGHSDADVVLHALMDALLGRRPWGTSAACSRTAASATGASTAAGSCGRWRLCWWSPAFRWATWT